MSRSTTPAERTAAARDLELLDLGVVGHLRAGRGGGDDEGERQSLRTCHTRVVPEGAAAQAVGVERGEEPQAFRPGEHPSGRDAPAGIEVAVASERKQVGERERCAEGRPARYSGPAGRHQDRKRLDQSRRHPQESRPFPDGVSHPDEVAAGQIPDAAVHDPQAVGRGRRPEIVPLQQGDLEPAQHRVPRDAGALNAASDDQNVVLYTSELIQVPPHRSGRRPPPAQACPEFAESVRSRTR